MVAEDGSPFSPGVNEALARLDDHTISKPVRLCVLGIVRDVIKSTKGASPEPPCVLAFVDQTDPISQNFRTS